MRSIAWEPGAGSEIAHGGETGAETRCDRPGLPAAGLTGPIKVHEMGTLTHCRAAGCGGVMSYGIFDRLGGEPTIETAVDLFYRKVLADSRVSHFFDDADMDAQRAKQKAFLSWLLGGPHDYDGNELRKAHAPLLERGLNETHFDIVAEHLKATLLELKVEGNIIAEAMIVIASTRNAILNK